MVEQLFKEGILSPDSVKAYLKEKNAELKLFAKIQALCSGVKKSVGNLALIKTWKEWNFNDEMILEAAARSATSSNPIPYINKILSDWKQAGIYEVKDIPSTETKGAGTGSTTKSGNFRTGYTDPTIEAANAKSVRERYYALRRERAQSLADRTVKKANENDRFKTITAQLSKLEIEIAKAEVRSMENLPILENKKAALLTERKELLKAMGIKEAELTPQFECLHCQDTGFLSSGIACACYKPEV